MNTTNSTQVVPAMQAAFYVSPTGNDSNPGTLAQPFQTIGRGQMGVRAIHGNMTSGQEHEAMPDVRQFDDLQLNPAFLIRTFLLFLGCTPS